MHNQTHYDKSKESMKHRKLVPNHQQIDCTFLLSWSLSCRYSLTYAKRMSKNPVIIFIPDSCSCKSEFFLQATCSTALLCVFKHRTDSISSNVDCTTSRMSAFHTFYSISGPHFFWIIWFGIVNKSLIRLFNS